MHWQALMAMLKDVPEHIWDKGMADHRPDEADNLEGGTYCLGCEVAELAQSLAGAIEDYVDARAEES